MQLTCLGIGLMSGTSMDGVDAALVEFVPAPKLLTFVTRSYPVDIRERLLGACDAATGTVDEVCELNFVVGELFAAAALEVCHKAGVSPADVAFIGSHGQTVHHLPRHQGVSTLQLGSPAVIAQRTGITTVSDFRSRDIAAGGEGAPLIPYVDRILFQRSDRRVAVQNIGGIGNVTFLPRVGEELPVLGFDTGPGNMVIDGVVNIISEGAERFDRDGARARRGTVVEPLLERLLQHPFLKRTPPRSTGREEFGLPCAREIVVSFHGEYPEFGVDDLVATVTRWTAASIALAYERFLPGPVSEVIVGGGGALNPTLMDMLRAELPGAQVTCHAEHGIPDEAKEALGFALLARETLLGRPANLPSVTGARAAVVLGSVTPGRVGISLAGSLGIPRGGIERPVKRGEARAT